MRGEAEDEDEHEDEDETEDGEEAKVWPCFIHPSHSSPCKMYDKVTMANAVSI